MVEWALIKELTLAQMKARYRRTFAGFVWVVLNPIILYSVQAFVFKNILRIHLPDYTLFLLGGLLPWIFVAMSLETGIPIFPSSRDLLTSLKVHPLSLILSSVLDNGINFIAAFGIMLFLGFFVSPFDLRGLAVMPLAILELFIGVAALLWLLSILNVFYRDVRFVTQFAIGVLFYLTPIFYPGDLIPQKYATWIRLNPIYAIIAPVRDSLYHYSPEHFSASLLKGLIVTAALISLSTLYWFKKRNEFYYSL